MAEIPTFDDYMKPMVAALRRLGGSATNNELYEAVVDEMKLSEEQLSLIHDPERGNQTEAAYRMAWARTWLKKAGFLTNSARGVWTLTQAGREHEIDPERVVASVRAAYVADRLATDAPPELAGAASAPEVIPDADEPDAPADWRSRLIRKLQRISPDAFERLCQRILRESGFIEVRVTGRSGDGGIDGIGILRLQRVVNFQVLFQCKRYQGSVSPKEIRDFRGAMVGRSDKGLFLTTGSFSRAAQEEATRDGAPPIDLIDGERLADLLKDLSLGVQTSMIEKVDVDEAWFDGV
ncbi:MAG TPA: restriction endonuclease [Polyangiaceae bacterium]|nr:restriction endonuclease [Polyangiaceae bacterium]